MIWQTKEWGAMLVASRQAKKTFDIGGIQVEKRSIGLGQYGLFIIGLDYTLDGVEGEMDKIEEYLVKLCQKEKAVFVQMEMLNYSGKLQDRFFDINRFNFGSYKRFIFQYSAIIDLTLTEEEILAGMHQKGRYNIKQAVKKGIEVQSVEINEENIKTFHTLMQETTQRDNFSGNTKNYYKIFLEKISDAELFLAYDGERVIAGGIFIFQKSCSYYYYGVSTSDREDKKLMAPYLLQWEAIKQAKEKGSKIYDFLGVAPEGVEKHPLTGVTDFKKKFTKNLLKVSEEYIYVEKNIIYRCLLLLRCINKGLKQVKYKICKYRNKKC